MKRLVYAVLALSMTSALFANDVIVLESTFVGDREQPAVSFFVPWQAPSGPESLYLDVESQIVYWLDDADRGELYRLYSYFNYLDDASGASSTPLSDQ